jgi:hypothetical protein
VQKLLLYGGSSGTTYDESLLTVELPWLDLKTPGTRKMAKHFDFALTSGGSLTWAISAGMDPVSGTLDSGVYDSADYTYDKGIVAWSSQGTHLRVRFVTSRHAAAAKLSSLTFHYQDAEEV